eukprot:220838_1
MAHCLEGTEGLDTSTFLGAHGLKDLIAIFENAQFSIDDLLICTEKDVRSICDDEFHLKPTQKIRLIKAIKSISSAEMNRKPKEAQAQVVFLGEEERKILDTLHKNSDIMAQNVKQIQIALDELSKSAMKCSKDIHQKYNEMVSILDKERTLLLHKIDTLKRKRSSELESYLRSMKSLNDATVLSADQCKKIAMKPNILSADRLRQMQQISNDFNQQTLHKKHHTLSTCKLYLNYDPHSFKSNLHKFINVDFQDDEQKMRQIEEIEINNALNRQWTFQQNHPKLKVSNHGLTVGDDHFHYGTIVFGEFLKSGFCAIEIKVDEVDDDDGEAGLCVIGKQFRKWDFCPYDNNDDTYLCVFWGGGIRGANEWMHFISKSEQFFMSRDDIVRIMIDLDKEVGEFKNKTKEHHIKFKIPKKPVAIAVCCSLSQFTVIKQMHSRSEYD